MALICVTGIFSNTHQACSVSEGLFHWSTYWPLKKPFHMLHPTLMCVCVCYSFNSPVFMLFYLLSWHTVFNVMLFLFLRHAIQEFITLSLKLLTFYVKWYEMDKSMPPYGHLNVIHDKWLQPFISKVLRLTTLFHWLMELMYCFSSNYYSRNCCWKFDWQI